MCLDHFGLFSRSQIQCFAEGIRDLSAQRGNENARCLLERRRRFGKPEFGCCACPLNRLGLQGMSPQKVAHPRTQDGFVYGCCDDFICACGQPEQARRRRIVTFDGQHRNLFGSAKIAVRHRIDPCAVLGACIEHDHVGSLGVGNLQQLTGFRRLDHPIACCGEYSLEKDAMRGDCACNDDFSDHSP